MSDTWTFGSISFYRQVNGDEPQWFPRTRERSIDVIAASATRIIDEGATTYAPMAFTALCTTSTAATNLEAAFASQATLTSPAGKTGQALCVKADYLIHDGTFYRVAVEFELVSS